MKNMRMNNEIMLNTEMNTERMNNEEVMSMRGLKRMEMKIMQVLGKGMVNAQNAIRSFRSEERGASELVIIIALIVVVIAVALIFKNQLINIVNAVGEKVMNWIGMN